MVTMMLLVDKVARFVTSIGYEPIVLHEQANKGMTIMEKLDKYSNVCFAIILYTPCDIGKKNQEDLPLENRARQNVIFEHGLFIGRLGRQNVVALKKQDVIFPNDLSGIVYIDYQENGTTGKLKSLKI